MTSRELQQARLTAAAQAAAEDERKRFAEQLGRLRQDIRTAQVGQHKRRTLADMVRDSGFSDTTELDVAVLSIDGRTYR